MSSAQSQASQEALTIDKQLAQGYYGIALPGLQARQGAINAGLGVGETGQMQDAFSAQRTGLTEGLSARGGAAQAQQMRGAKSALSGGNMSAALSPADVGAQLANALYGSKFQEGQANLNQQFNLTSMGLGGAGTTGNAAVTAAGQQLGAIGYLPQYNQTYANIAGGAAGLSSLYGAYNQWAAGQQPAAGLMAGGNQGWGGLGPTTVGTNGLLESGGWSG